MVETNLIPGNAIAVRLSERGKADVLLTNHKKNLFHEVKKARNTIGSDRKILEQVQMKAIYKRKKRSRHYAEYPTI